MSIIALRRWIAALYEPSDSSRQIVRALSSLNQALTELNAHAEAMLATVERLRRECEQANRRKRAAGPEA